MSRQALIAGGGIGGLAAALAASRAGWDVRLYERAPVFSEVGAGVQLGPNVVRVLNGWGLEAELAKVAAFPTRLQVRDARSGRELGVLPLGEQMQKKYGAPYVTIHRADLHGLLLQAVQARANVWLKLNTSLTSYTDSGSEVTLKTLQSLPASLAGGAPADAAMALAPLDNLLEIEGDALIGADGLWSCVRNQMLNDGPPRITGHLAYRAMLPQASLPEPLHSQQVTVWLGPQLHVVAYPVRGGEWLNVVLIVHGQVQGDLHSWDHSANAEDAQAATQFACGTLRSLIEAIPDWRLWPLCDRPPLSGAHQQAQGCVALLGDAAHPMRPYMAQGAGMAIEDATELGSALAQALDPAFDVPTLLQRYALNRWQRNAQVQARSVRNGQLFHAQGLLRWGRDTGMKLLGEKVLDVPWLYGAIPRTL